MTCDKISPCKYLEIFGRYSEKEIEIQKEREREKYTVFATLPAYNEVLETDL